MRRALARLAPAVLLAGCVAPPPPLPLPGPLPAPGAAPAASGTPAPGAAGGQALATALDAARGGRGAAPVLLDAPLAGGGTQPVALLTLPDTVLFDFGVATPRAGSGPVLDALARGIAAAPGASVLTVAGNTDAIGTDGLNQALSVARARAVVAALVARGVAPGRLDAVGFGRSRPVADNASADGRARNRRVELALSGSAEANLAALEAVAPVEAASAATPVAAKAASILRTPAPLALQRNRPERLQANPLGPPVSY